MLLGLCVPAVLFCQKTICICFMQILCFWHALWLSDEDGWRKTVRSRICPVSDCRIIWVERYLLKIIKSNAPVLSRGIFIYMRLLWALGGFVPWSSQAQRWGWQVSSPQDLPFLVFFVSLAKFSSSSVLAFLTPSLYLYKQYPCILSRIPLPVSTDCIFFYFDHQILTHPWWMPSFPDLLHVGIENSY